MIKNPITNLTMSHMWKLAWRFCKLHKRTLVSSVIVSVIHPKLWQNNFWNLHPSPTWRLASPKHTLFDSELGILHHTNIPLKPNTKCMNLLLTGDGNGKWWGYKGPIRWGGHNCWGAGGPGLKDQEGEDPLNPIPGAWAQYWLGMEAGSSGGGENLWGEGDIVIKVLEGQAWKIKRGWWVLTPWTWYQACGLGIDWGWKWEVVGVKRTYEVRGTQLLRH